MPNYADRAADLRDLAETVKRDRWEYPDRTDSGPVENLSRHVETLTGAVAGLASALADWFGEKATAPDEGPQHAATVNLTVPGQMTATYIAGKVTRLTFTPHAGGAGYFGPSAEIYDWTDGLAGDGSGPFRDVAHVVAMVEPDNIDGPFWTAMREALEVVADLDGDHGLTYKAHHVPIEWTE